MPERSIAPCSSPSATYHPPKPKEPRLVALGDLSSAQAKGTEATNRAVTQLLDYCATHSEASIRYCASEMALQIHSNASYLSVAKGGSPAGGHLYLGTVAKSTKPILNNGAVLTISGILKHVMSSAAEAEVAGLFVNAKEGEILRTTLDEMGYPQEPTPIKETILLPVVSRTTPSTNSAHAPSTCVSTGYVIV
jgi:hypothetical protein